ncbi:MAG: hypothetical protein K6E78_10495, partial [Treponema sp.]|nr:hypothetical protein [Treponema sp.]
YSGKYKIDNQKGCNNFSSRNFHFIPLFYKSNTGKEIGKPDLFTDLFTGQRHYSSISEKRKLVKPQNWDADEN